MVDFYEKMIGPVIYEQDASKIMQAFKDGCSAVIIDGQIPDNVRAEIAVAPVPMSDNDELLERGLELRSYADHAEDVAWKGRVFPGMNETFQWLSEQGKLMVRMGLRPSFDIPSYGEKDKALMTFWQGRATDLPWHTDNTEPIWPDVHFHVYGDGIKIAAPKMPSVVHVAGHGKLISQFEKAADKAEKTQSEINEILSAELIQRGFEILTLQPGQILVFRENCLHRSAETPREQMKIRAAMF